MQGQLAKHASPEGTSGQTPKFRSEDQVPARMAQKRYKNVTSWRPENRKYGKKRQFSKNVALFGPKTRKHAFKA